MKNLVHAILVLTAVTTVQSCGKKPTVQQEVSEVIPVKVIPLSKTKSQSTLQVSGQFTTDDETILSFKTGGVIKSVKVREGDAIKKGQILATLDLTEIDAQVAQAQLAFEKTQRDFNRLSKLYKDSVVTLEQYQNSKTGFDIAQKQLDAARFNRSFSEIRAISDGYVLKKFVNEGQVITPGSSVLQTNGARQGKWILRSGISDRDWSAITLSDKAIITVDAFPDQPISAAVTRKSEGTDPSTGAFTVELTITEKPGYQLASGMFAKASIIPSKATDSWTIPFDALLDGDAKNGYVFITEDNKTAKKVDVRISGISKDRVSISSGLENAKSLIVSGSAYLKDSAAIRIIE